MSGDGLCEIKYFSGRKNAKELPAEKLLCETHRGGQLRYGNGPDRPLYVWKLIDLPGKVNPELEVLLHFRQWHGYFFPKVPLITRPRMTETPPLPFWAPHHDSFC